MTPPKNYTYTYSPKSHGQCDFILHIHTPLFNIHTSYKSKSNDALLFNAWPCPSWDGLGLFGLWPSWAWAWALGLGLIFILRLLLILRRLEGRTSNVKANVLFLH